MRRNVLTDPHPALRIGDRVLYQQAHHDRERSGVIKKLSPLCAALYGGELLVPTDWVRIVDTRTGEINRTAAGIPTWPAWPAVTPAGDDIKIKPRICSDCGTEFLPTGGRQVRCRDCGAAATAAANRAANARYYAKHPRPPRKRARTAAAPAPTPPGPGAWPRARCAHLLQFLARTYADAPAAAAPTDAERCAWRELDTHLRALYPTAQDDPRARAPGRPDLWNCPRCGDYRLNVEPTCRHCGTHRPDTTPGDAP